MDTMVYRLINYCTQKVVAEFPESLFSNELGARHSAQLQARRHADGGTPILLTGGSESVLYLPPNVTERDLKRPLPKPCEVRYYDDHTRRKVRRAAGEQLPLPIAIPDEQAA